jgi:hypothetical protein
MNELLRAGIMMRQLIKQRRHLILAVAALLAATNLRDGQSASIECYIKDDKGRSLKGFDIWTNSCCQSDLNFLLLPIVAKGTVGSVKIKFPASPFPIGQKHPRTDEDEYFRLSVQPDHVYYFTASRERGHLCGNCFLSIAQRCPACRLVLDFPYNYRRSSIWRSVQIAG